MWASTEAVERDAFAEANAEVDRGKMIGGAMAISAKWAARFIIVSIAVAILFWCCLGFGSECSRRRPPNGSKRGGTDIASGVFTGVSAVTSGFVTLALMLVLRFFLIKDGPAFLPWLRRASGHTVGQHLTEMLTRVWVTLGGFIHTQAVVSAVDAFFIGLGLVILDVPLAPALAIVTFMAGFVPILGAVTARATGGLGRAGVQRVGHRTVGAWHHPSSSCWL